ncbi:MAG: class I SAM-dependent methyltransferase [Clostridiales bacterium]|jgi:trans-aconitate methyltransferase|nr:class I SAM-dependent methyltransferase [Clostridiales bacterium]
MNIKWKSEEYKENFSFVHEYGEDVLKLLKIDENSLVIDLGCGNGALTKKLSEICGGVIGIDSSEEMLKTAKKSYPNLTFIREDALNFNLEKKADAVFSNAVFHWIDKDKQSSLLKNINRNLKLNGQLVCEFGGFGCAETIHSALETEFNKKNLAYPRTFYFPTIGEYAPILEKNGFKVSFASLFDRKTKLNGKYGLKDWINMFVTEPFKNIDHITANEIITNAVNKLKPILFENGVWYADYVRIRFKAQKNRTV